MNRSDSLWQGPPITSMDRTANNAVLDIESLPQPPDKCCSGSPKMIRALSRKGSNRMERRGGGGGEQEQEDLAKKLVIKVVPSQLEQQPLGQNKALVAPHCTPVLVDSGEGRSKRFISRFTSINPRKILLLFATLSSVGTTILIYFTLAINSKAEA
ncbi:uncharacterized protein [Zea mays]|uniref:Uncharacterized protein n=1 Tax=Zea mays TaxID=4577 RepID=A0A1D6JHU6_MAIZE|nr:uncharacterized protein LOC100276102 isoform X1 [Zea mays]XP_020400558.1 uncharacterized protein LOC100276102 isoform X1 [Zea mays]AQK47190.1 hypothetical protein ZEAMMB73_Zm00001d026591 [Zea mays]|eukprot:XP_020400557.1 uncharacterized protein LOC100276102 isoform X1 [Zea mays]